MLYMRHYALLHALLQTNMIFSPAQLTLTDGALCAKRHKLYARALSGKIVPMIGVAWMLAAKMMGNPSPQEKVKSSAYLLLQYYGFDGSEESALLLSPFFNNVVTTILLLRQMALLQLQIETVDKAGGFNESVWRLRHQDSTGHCTGKQDENASKFSLDSKCGFVPFFKLIFLENPHDAKEARALLQSSYCVWFEWTDTG
jgi:hypothetical protein